MFGIGVPFGECGMAALPRRCERRIFKGSTWKHRRNTFRQRMSEFLSCLFKMCGSRAPSSTMSRGGGLSSGNLKSVMIMTQPATLKPESTSSPRMYRQRRGQRDDFGVLVATRFWRNVNASSTVIDIPTRRSAAAGIKAVQILAMLITNRGIMILNR